VTQPHAIFQYVSDQTPADLIAEAWRVLADFDLDPTGKTGRSDLGYFDDEWCKMARRTIRGFAEVNKRPWTWPWPEPQFDQFPWKVST